MEIACSESGLALNCSVAAEASLGRRQAQEECVPVFPHRRQWGQLREKRGARGPSFQTAKRVRVFENLNLRGFL